MTNTLKTGTLSNTMVVFAIWAVPFYHKKDCMFLQVAYFCMYYHVGQANGCSGSSTFFYNK